MNSIRARLGHVTGWLKERTPDVLLMQELKGEVFPGEVFREMGYESVAVTQKTYNGVAILSHRPIETTNTTLAGDDRDSHARFLETIISGLRIVDIYLPNGNPIGTDKFTYKLAWMDRLSDQMARWLRDPMPTVIGGDFNVIPEDIDCKNTKDWVRDALFQPESRSRYRAMLESGYVDAFRKLNPGLEGAYTFWDFFRQAFEKNRGIRIDHFLLSPGAAERLIGCEIDRGPRGMERPSDHTPIIVELRD